MAFKIYTKTGDDGTTGLFGGARMTKDHIRIEAYGTVDELNTCIGLVAAESAMPGLAEDLQGIQSRLFTMGAVLASDPDKDMPTPDLVEADIAWLEAAIDRMDTALPELRHFILPGGSRAVAAAHLARTVCRRAERRCVTLSREAAVPEIIIRYLNRLSDYFFVLARWIGHREGTAEIKWIGRQEIKE